MNEPSSGQPKLTSRTVAEKAARADRLAAEMRKNLLKRKRQRRELTAAHEDGEADGDPAKRD